MSLYAAVGLSNSGTISGANVSGSTCKLLNLNGHIISRDVWLSAGNNLLSSTGWARAGHALGYQCRLQSGNRCWS
ncbi:hypothetical protein [Xanthomonas graminis]|uniref:Uncharacterized protein n=1 Tax=Xanthomonas graminis pv. arrhenatheri LMG 727 TaxID=1195923 RepID=A0A0K2ZWG7_9XANT|nr:hypothetical protein [Xanthomonas translucens]UKE77627.1 hypothetical protein KM317_19880 [Xanthomonas translucens pv. arrhenatheri]CTP89387.1 hypothetical protein XTALMG727_2697 [Xanthomonas translucens pv. arrhenatheri LMG 727]